jgi:predicted porin
MKKSLIALAVLSTIAGSAVAQSSVTVYGVVDVNITSSENGSNPAQASTALGDNGLANSRLGFRGTEDLGGGLKAEFQLEANMTPTTGQVGANGTTTGNNNAANQTAPVSTIFNREAWVGLSSTKFGSIRMGRTDITSAQSLDSTVGQAGNFTDASGNLGTDVSKVVRYTTPTFAGFSAQVGYSNPDSSSTVSAVSATANASTGEITTGRMTSVYAQYEAGKFGVYAGQVEKKITATYDQKETTYGAKYDFGFAAVGAYRSERDAAAFADVATKGDFVQTIISASAPVAALGSGVKAHASYFKNEYDVANLTGDVDGYKLALTKAFSKRTTGYVAYVDQSTNNTTDKDATTYVVGITHAF